MTEYEAVSEMQEALNSLSVNTVTLSEAEKENLDTKGYLLLPGIIAPAWLVQLQQLYETLMREEGKLAGTEVHGEEGARRLADLVNKGQPFDSIYTQPKLLAAVYYILKRPFKLYSLNGRDALPGYGQQALHSDWGSRNLQEPFHLVNSVWMLDDFSAENGATRVVPGSHQLKGLPTDYLQDLTVSHPDQLLLEAPAGTVAVFNAHLWHGGTLNRSQHTRRALHCSFTCREFEQQLNQRQYIRAATLDRISAAARYILDA